MSRRVEFGQHVMQPKTGHGGHWFTELCNSQRLSCFAAPFIGAPAKISVAESCAHIG